jgi:transposase
MRSAERRQWERWRRHRAGYEQAIRLHRDGVTINSIARRLGISRNTLRRWLQGAAPALHRPRQNTLEPYRALPERRWAEGCHNGAQLWREVCEAGFAGGLRVVTERATRQRLSGLPGRMGSDFTLPSSRRIARSLTMDLPKLDKAERGYLDQLLAESAPLARLRDLAMRFAAMVRGRTSEAFEAWQADAAGSELQSFANGLGQDEAAVRAALSLPWSNGQTEGQINRLKLIKRQMYGRGGFDLLRARVLQTA